VTIDAPRSSALNLDQPPAALGLQHARGTFELHEILTQLLVGGDPQILRPELIEGGTQRAHASDASDGAFAAQ